MTDEAKPRVLFVDDEAENLDTLRRVFRKQLTVEVAQSGAQALRLLRERQYEAIVVDFAMPGMNGAQLLQAASELQPETVRLMVTAHAELGEVRSLRTSGMVQRTIVKPWAPEDLLHWIQNAARMTSLRRSVSNK